MARLSIRTATSLALLVASVCFAASAHASDRVYWGGYGSSTPLISFANTDGSGGADLNTGAATVSEPFGVAIDSAAGMIYWANDSGNAISVAKLDGSGGHDLPITGVVVNNPEGIAVDPVARKLYFVNNGPPSIVVANLDGSGAAPLSTTGATLNVPEGIAIDPVAGRVYWTNSGATTIGYANADGSGGGGNLNLTGTTVSSPLGLAIDRAAGRVYYANYGVSKISYENLDGSGGGDVNTTGTTVNHPYGVAVDHASGRIYFMNYPGNKLSYANLDGSGGGDIPTPGATVDGPAFPALQGVPRPAGAPLATGSGIAGLPLSCSAGSWAPDSIEAFLFLAPQSIGYQWSRNGADVPGAIASSLTPTTAGDYRCRVTASNAAGAAAQTSSALAVASKPTISRLTMSHRIFAPGRISTPLTGLTSAKRHPRGTVFSFALDQAARVKIAIRTKVAGRRAGGKCRRATRRLRSRPLCTRTITVGPPLIRTAHAGTNKVPFSGRVRRRALKPRRYQAVFVATTRAGAGAAKKLAFRVVRR